jgi:hypothetical protein
MTKERQGKGRRGKSDGYESVPDVTMPIKIVL